MTTPSLGDKFKSQSPLLTDGDGPPDDTGPQAPNVFTVIGIADGLTPGVPEGYIGTLQKGREDWKPAWWKPETFADRFEPLPT